MMTLETTDYSITARQDESRRAHMLLVHLKTWLATRRQRRAHQAAYRALLKADGYLLRDIGVTRHDVAALLADVRAG